MIRRKENFMDYIPSKNPNLKWHNENGKIIISVENKGFFNGVARIFFKRPRMSRIHLEEFGSFIWQQLDSKRDVYEISLKVKERFGEKAEPLNERLMLYFKKLWNLKFITLDRTKSKAKNS